MTREEAIAIRTQQLQGGRVLPADLEQALRVIRETNQPVTDKQVQRARQESRYCKGPKRSPWALPQDDDHPGAAADHWPRPSC